MKKIICLYGGPGSGKSTSAALLFAKVKTLGYNAEMNREYIKNWVWEERKPKLGDQTYIFAKSSRVERILMENNVELIITDSPLLLTHFNGLKYDQFERDFNTSLKMLEHHHAICKYYGYKVEHYVINRGDRKYNPKGRYQDEKEAISFDVEIKSMLNELNIKYKEINDVKEIIEDLNLLDINQK